MVTEFSVSNPFKIFPASSGFFFFSPSLFSVICRLALGTACVTNWKYITWKKEAAVLGSQIAQAICPYRDSLWWWICRDYNGVGMGVSAVRLVLCYNCRFLKLLHSFFCRDCKILICATKLTEKAISTFIFDIFFGTITVSWIYFINYI